MAGMLKVLTETQEPSVHPYTRELLTRAERSAGPNSKAYRGIYNQYFRMPQSIPGVARSERHYNALGDLPVAVERLYRRVAVVDLLTACASECVFCIRGLYETHSLTEDEMDQIVAYLGSDPHLTEVLITGGDPLIAPGRLNRLVDRIATSATNIQSVRIGTRLPVQNPLGVSDEIYRLFRRWHKQLRFEVVLQVNHPFELQEESIDVIEEIQQSGGRIYSQNVLLKGVNDDLETLIELYDRLRYLDVAPHYLFHAVPMIGTDEFRTSIRRGLDLTRSLSTCGHISGLAKPVFSVMTDVGKVTLYEGHLLSERDGVVTFRTAYRLEDRQRWNPGYRLPESAAVNRHGTIDVTYVDGSDDEGDTAKQEDAYGSSS